MLRMALQTPGRVAGRQKLRGSPRWAALLVGYSRASSGDPQAPHGGLLLSQVSVMPRLGEPVHNSNKL